MGIFTAVDLTEACYFAVAASLCFGPYLLTYFDKPEKQLVEHKYVNNYIDYD